MSLGSRVQTRNFVVSFPNVLITAHVVAEVDLWSNKDSSAQVMTYVVSHQNVLRFMVKNVLQLRHALEG